MDSKVFPFKVFPVKGESELLGGLDYPHPRIRPGFFHVSLFLRQLSFRVGLQTATPHRLLYPTQIDKSGSWVDFKRDDGLKFAKGYTQWNLHRCTSSTDFFGRHGDL
ncbi:hypothetical protein L2E82_14725 [Cichorium intybus]|uniref:Uncharacterized protein n=1 Tax=Cichorium intybus TaxID=13427 RepID=A0ACB9F225_CICIN|nr:hypothetical protein L2E82_14725 [Cichorium intybus]